MIAPLSIDSFAGSAGSFGDVPSELPDHHSGEHIPSAGMQHLRDVPDERATCGWRQSDDRADDQPDAEYAESRGCRESGDADELEWLHNPASELTSHFCPVRHGNGATGPSSAHAANATPTFRPLRHITLHALSTCRDDAIRRNVPGSATSGLISSSAPWSQTFQTRQSSGGKRSPKKIPPILKASLRRDLLRSTNIAEPKPRTRRNACIHYAGASYRIVVTHSIDWGNNYFELRDAWCRTAVRPLNAGELNGMPEVRP
ncbi:hypothetical protein ABIE45_003832 [Methylobacterium sp. OAE515]